MVRVFKAVGQSPQIVKVVSSRGGNFLAWAGVQFATRGDHEAVLVDGTIYDSLVGRGRRVHCGVYSGVGPERGRRPADHECGKRRGDKMRTTQDALAYIEEMIACCVENPGMYAANPVSLEAILIQLDDLAAFLRSEDTLPTLVHRSRYSEFIEIEGFWCRELYYSV